MDRNIKNCVVVLIQPVALRKESVDRNTCALSTVANLRGSLSARRAWIEIPALQIYWLLLLKSLSARRAWIEMPCLLLYGYCGFVALRKESVDRNTACAKLASLASSRSPQGERG